MHLGLKTGPLCPMFYTKLKEPSSFSDVADGLCIYFPNILWVQRKEPRYVCLSESKALVRLLNDLRVQERNPDILFSQKSRQMNPSRFPNRAPMERKARLQSILHISQKPHLSGSPVKEPSPKVPFMKSLAERCTATRALLHSSISLRLPF